MSMRSREIGDRDSGVVWSGVWTGLGLGCSGVGDMRGIDVERFVLR